MSLLYKILISNKKICISIVTLGIISGALSFGFLAFFNFVIKVIINGQYKTINESYIVIYLLIILFLIWSRKTMSEKVIKFSQILFWSIRFEILRIVLKADYQQLIKNKNKIHSSLMNDVDNLTEASLGIIEFTISSIVVIFCFIYMGLLSTSLLIITFFSSIFGVFIYWVNAKKNNEKLEISRKLENSFYKYLNSILDGFKEIYMNRRIGNDVLVRKIKPIAKDAYNSNVKAFTGLLNNQMTGQLIFYFLMASILLVFSVLLKVEAIAVVNFTFILLYLLAAIESIMVMLPGLMKSKISLKNLLALKTELESTISITERTLDQFEQSEFKEIYLSEITFSYYNNESKKSFQIGPIDLKINAGDVVFIYGGNGSGKTTFVNSLIGLFKPDKGTIYFNDYRIESQNYEYYKSIFSVIFSDFYLFDEFYGLDGYDFQQAEEYLKLFELFDKVQMTPLGFSTLVLSTGQRKRLALINALLEDRPILVLDEWAADQDPYFRKKFYTEIIPLLKSRGLTIIAITHDDKYYHCADKIYKMEFGKLYEETHLIIEKQTSYEA